MLKIALAKGRIAKEAMNRLIECGCHFDDYSKDSRKLIFSNVEETLEVTLVKSQDVPVYVETGTSDIGIVGSDILLEEPFDVYVLEELNIGRCRMATAGPVGLRPNYARRLTVASKYPNITRQFYDSRGIITNIIKLNGSVELAPLTGLSDIIVDIVESGRTLTENGLEPYEFFLNIQSELIANKISFKTKNQAIANFIDQLAPMIGDVSCKS